MSGCSFDYNDNLTNKLCYAHISTASDTEGVCEVAQLRATVERVESVLRICDFEVDRDSDGNLTGEPIAVVPVLNVTLALGGDR